MARIQERTSVEGYGIQVLFINGETQNQFSDKFFYIENIGKGGFRFLSDVHFELEDRLQVLLQFPNGDTQEVLGRICYSEQQDNNQSAFGFSIIEGFYSLKAANG